MSNNIMKTKRGQYYPRPSYSSVNPLLIIGIILFVIPFMFPIIRMHPPGWVNSIFTTGGLFAIMVGAALSIFKSSN